MNKEIIEYINKDPEALKLIKGHNNNTDFVVSLIQRCTIAHNYPDLMVGDLLNLDYMGSSEFEFGAVARALKGFYVIMDDLEIFRFSYKEEVIFILTTAKRLPTVMRFLDDMSKHKARTKEHTNIDNFLNKKEVSNNFWFDIINLFALAVNKQDLINFKIAVVESNVFMAGNKMDTEKSSYYRAVFNVPSCEETLEFSLKANTEDEAKIELNKKVTEILDEPSHTIVSLIKYIDGSKL